jgi:hypothetical protein
MTDGFGIEIDCLMLLDPDEPEVINEIWTEAVIKELNLNTPQQ